ncbi:hypothetical protein HPB51_007254 [Rhipicephalus microplus]|uniref:Uncharacterized protein n=1 Tax=Rhipicephalus microplus TaxID=6941 RepID=A0A9J6E0Z8_RHIMP|nr:hypothetical protein HPB51_007254 [Rhipicephalus microplus]
MSERVRQKRAVKLCGGADKMPAHENARPKRRSSGVRTQLLSTLHHSPRDYAVFFFWCSAAATNKTYAKRVRLDLTKLAKKKIIHYGSLNVFEVADKIKDRVMEVIETMKEFKKIQKNDPNKRIVVAIGGVEYSSADAWAAFKESIMMAADKDTGIDTVIAISSTNQLLTDQKAGNCIVVPPNTIHSSNMNFPTLARNLELVNEANQFMYGNRDAVVGLSLEMGAMMYTFSSDQELSPATAYKECKYATLVTLDMGCSSNPQQIVRDTVMGFGQETRRFVIVHDNKTTLERKFKYVLARHPRKRFAWLYFDVNMADLVQSCGLRNPFEFLQTLRTTFGIHDKPDET